MLSLLRDEKLRRCVLRLLVDFAVVSTFHCRLHALLPRNDANSQPRISVNCFHTVVTASIDRQKTFSVAAAPWMGVTSLATHR